MVQEDDAGVLFIVIMAKSYCSIARYCFHTPASASTIDLCILCHISSPRNSPILHAHMPNSCDRDTSPVVANGPRVSAHSCQQITLAGSGVFLIARSPRFRSVIISRASLSSSITSLPPSPSTLSHSSTLSHTQFYTNNHTQYY